MPFFINSIGYHPVVRNLSVQTAVEVRVLPVITACCQEGDAVITKHAVQDVQSRVTHPNYHPLPLFVPNAGLRSATLGRTIPVLFALARTGKDTGKDWEGQTSTVCIIELLTTLSLRSRPLGSVTVGTP